MKKGSKIEDPKKDSRGHLNPKGLF